MLQWIQDKVKEALKKVQETIDWVYGLYLDTLSRIARAIEIAKNYVLYYAITYYNLAVNQINIVIGYLYQLVMDIRSQIIITLLALINDVSARITNVVNGIGAYIEPFIVTLRGWITAALTQVYNWVLQQLSPLIGVVNWIRDRIGELSNVLSAIRVLSLDDIVKIVTGQIQPIIQNAKDFLNDPVGYILAIVVDNFSPILSAIIAYGMGTVKYDLPPAPVFYQKNKRK